jgi:hypothetical protein
MDRSFPCGVFSRIGDIYPNRQDNNTASHQCRNRQRISRAGKFFTSPNWFSDSIEYESSTAIYNPNHLAIP